MSKINIKPLADRILVEPAAAETKTSSGIIIPDSAKEKPQKGKVVAVRICFCSARSVCKRNKAVKRVASISIY